MATLKNLTINDTGHIQLPTGTTGERPGSPTVGMVRFNTTTTSVEVYTAAGWVAADEKQTATGGTIATTGGYRIHTFTSSASFVPTYTGPVDILLVGGGGAGASGIAGGGGAGGMLYNQGVLVTGGTTYPIAIGPGGAAGGANHGNDNHTRGTDTTGLGLTALGGGAGMAYPSPDAGAPKNFGGSGGGGPGGHVSGASWRPAVEGATLGQGFPGGAGAHWPGTPAGTHYGGGGGGGAGENGWCRVGNWPTSQMDEASLITWDLHMRGVAAGGDGASSAITGTANYYAGGGAGGNHGPGNNYGWASARGGLGGGGDAYPGATQSYGGDGTYYGGGGASGTYPYPNEAGGNGYQGIVVVRYKAS